MHRVRFEPPARGQHLRCRLDNPKANDKPRALVGWEPTRPGWVADVTLGHYFD